MTSTWTADFISPSFLVGDEVGTQAGCLRREFTVTAGLRRATLHVTALGLIEAYLNGTRVGDHVLAPGWTPYQHRLVVDGYDVTKLLVEGRNAIGAMIGEGWAVGRLGWEGRRRIWGDHPAAFVQLDLEFADRIETVRSDGRWKAGEAPLLSNSIYDGESYDARAEFDGWNQAGFNDDGWGGVDLVEVDHRSLIAASSPPIRRIEEGPAVAVTTTPSGRTVVDFGQVLTGWVRFTVSGDAGATVTLHHCETLVGEEPDFTTNRSAEATDRYTLRGGGPETWEPRFTFHGFRYVEVIGWPGGAPDRAAFTAVVVHSDMERTGWFDSSHELLNKLHRNVVWSMRGNFVGIPTDCPQRDERLGWTGDINAFGPTAAFLYNVHDVLGSWLTDLAHEQSDKGFVPFVVPNVLEGPAPPTALWGDVAVSLPWTLYQEYGDIAVLERQYASMTSFIDDVEARLDSNGLWSKGFQYGDWLDPDAPPNNPGAAKSDAHLVATAYLCRTTSELAKTAEVLGRTADVEHYAALHDRVRSAFRHEWVSPAGLLVNEAATSYALAICFDLLEPEQETRAGAKLAAMVAKAGYRISTGFAGTPLVMHALSRTGQLDTAYRLLLQTECPSFLYPVTMGATTIWERWDAIEPDGSLNDTGMTSLNHYALGAVADWLHRVVGGLEPAEPGYRRMRIAPQPGGGLTHASVIHDTAQGRVCVAWRREGARMTVDVTIPQKASATVVLPGHSDGLVIQVEGGEYRWEYDVAVPPRHSYNLDTPLRELATDPVLWPAITAVFTKHFPEHVGASGGADALGGATLRDITNFVPTLASELEADLVEVLSA